MDPLFLLAQQIREKPPEVRTVDPVQNNSLPGIIVTPQKPMPEIPAKEGKISIPEPVQDAMKATLPLFQAEADTAANSGHDKKTLLKQLRESGVTSIDARIWEQSDATLVVIDKAQDQQGQNVYYALTADHVFKQSASAPPYTDMPHVVMTPGGQEASVKYLGTVEDIADPAYADRDLALVSFTSTEDIALARRGNVVPGQLDKKATYYLSGFPSQLDKPGDNNIPYGNDFTSDPAVTIGAPRIVKGNVNTQIIPVDLVTQQVTDPVLLKSGNFPTAMPRNPDGSYPDDPLMSGNFSTKFNPSARLSYIANTHFGHSGSPVFNQQGEVIIIHNASDQAPEGGQMRGPGLSEGCYLDGKTNQIIDHMIQDDMQKHNHVRGAIFNASPSGNITPNGVKGWQQKRAENQPKTPALQNSPGRRPG